MTIKTKVIDAANEQWSRWGFSVRPLHKAAKIVGLESEPPYVVYVADYWSVVNKPTWNGNTPQPWSAAFISFCFKTAGAAKQFPYATGHFDYCAAMAKSPQKYPFKIEDPATATLEPGDVLWAARSGASCPSPPATHSKALAALKNGKWFCSHADVVVAVRNGEADVIGGNVSNSVTKVTYVTVGDRIRDSRHDWLGVLKSAL